MDKPDNRWKLPFFTIWTGQAFSLLGSQLVGFALIWYLTVQTGSATVLAAATTVQMLPRILLSPFAGALIDRWPRKWTLILSDMSIALLTGLLGLLFWLGVAQPWHVVVILFLRSVGDVFQNPTMFATTAAMVPRDWLPRVSGMNSMLDGILRFIAPAMGAVLLSLASIQVILWLDVVTALLAVGPLFFIAIPQPARKAAVKRPSMWQDMGEAARYMWGWRGLRWLVFTSVLLGFLASPSRNFVPLLVTQHFGGGVAELALLQSVGGIATIVGGLALSAWGGFKRTIATSILGTLMTGIARLLLGLAPTHAFWLGLAGFALGYLFSSFHLAQNAIFQAMVPPEMQGRFFSFQRSMYALAQPVALLIAGPIADRIGVQPFYLIAALGSLVAVLIRRFSYDVYHIEDTIPKPAAASAEG